MSDVFSTDIGGPEGHDAIFHDEKSIKNPPPELQRATWRLEFPPSYVVVGAYRLLTDSTLYLPIWRKCKHGTVRGALVGTVWALITFNIQKGFIKLFLMNSPRITGLSHDTMFGYKIPFDIHTYAALLLVGSQVSGIVRFFLSRNLNIARERAWAQTVVSRGKSADFWQPYVEEWDRPPLVTNNPLTFWETIMQSSFGRLVIKRVILAPFALYPFVGIAVSAGIKAFGTARYLHKQYFQAKKMTDREVALFVKERQWDYWCFGFAAALLEGLPIIGLVFSVSNRIGAAMWAHDLEKRQHHFAREKRLLTISPEIQPSPSSL